MSKICCARAALRTARRFVSRAGCCFRGCCIAGPALAPCRRRIRPGTAAAIVTTFAPTPRSVPAPSAPPLTCSRPKRRGSRGKGHLDAAAALPPGRTPRIARLLALALHCDALIREGHIADYAALAALGQVTRPRITQIMNLLYLAPD